MEIKGSTRKPDHSPSVSESNHDEKEISDDDDDRNHKHRRRDDARSQSQERDSAEQVYTTPFKRGNKPPDNGHSYRESVSRSSEPWKNYGLNPMGSNFDKRRPSALNQINRMDPGPGRGRGRDPGVWTQHDIIMGPGRFSGRGLQGVSNAYGASWGAFGLVPGLQNSGLDQLHPLGLQGAYRSVNPYMNMGLGRTRQRCRDFEEQGFCLRGDMCPMEHGVNRIVVEDFQSLSQFNLPVSLQNANMPGAPVGPPFKPQHGKGSKHEVGLNGPGLNGAFVDSTGGVGADFYDPDQPLLGNDSQPSPALQSVNQSKVKRSGLLLGSAGPGPSVHHVGLLDSSDELVKSIKNKTEMGERLVSKANPLIEKQGQLNNKRNDVNSPLKTVRNPSQRAQCTLFVNGIPLQQNRRETLISHFRKFGEVVDIHIPPNTERAYVQFSRKEEAEAALMAPDAVMGNRFIKLWWANRDNIPVNGTISSPTALPVPPRGVPVSSAPHNHTIALASNQPKPAPPSQKKLENLEVLKEELRKKQEMLDQKRNDFRRKLDKLEKQALKVEIEPKQVAKKPKLGIEVVGNGNKSIVPQRPKPVAAVAPLQPPVLKPSQRPLPPVGPSVVSSRFKLDNRPTAFRIISPLPDELTNVVVLKEHFSQFGDLVKVELDNPEPADSNNDPGTGKYSVRVHFRSRQSAEKAFLSGKCWNGHNLQFSWLKSSTLYKDSESHPPASKGNSEASIGSAVIPETSQDVVSEKIEQKKINKEQTSPGS